MKKYSTSKHHTLTELNITPLLDLAFVLLVIFVITTAPPVSDMDMSLPSSENTTPKDAARKANYVEINNEGRIRLNSVDMKDENQLLNTLIELRKADIDYQRVINVLDVLMAANILKVGLATEPVVKAGQ
jgi:biopolymer transport protein ExbD